nr:MAG TPA: hypothetical protein [Caudoviricetes sp.]
MLFFCVINIHMRSLLSYRSLMNCLSLLQDYPCFFNIHIA